eukprot:c5640_g1_i2.p1 GENE.c5640_g1_i2~~c5640_g1_i2.p1  ORF type:complete len:184 (+),score=54.57 c5640_g1_i2:50-553(+)
MEASSSYSSPHLMKQLFSQKLSSADKDSLFRDTNQIGFTRNQSIVFEGVLGGAKQLKDSDYGLCLLVKGNIRQQRLVYKGCSIVTFGYFHPGDIFGIECFLTNTRAATNFVVCSDKAIVKFIPYETLIMRLQDDPLLQVRFYRDLAVSLSLNPCTMVNHEDEEMFVY